MIYVDWAGARFGAPMAFDPEARLVSFESLKRNPIGWFFFLAIASDTTFHEYIGAVRLSRELFKKNSEEKNTNRARSLW